MPRVIALVRFNRPSIGRIVLALVASAFGPGAPARAGDGPVEESERRYEGFVPGPSEDPDFALWRRIVDAATGEPIPGARLIRHEEDTTESALQRAPVLGWGEADPTGIAHCEAAEGDQRPSSHWVVRAPGYAPQCEFATFPPALVPLRRGERVTLRVLDAFGEPVEGAALDVFDGCSHAPALARATSDAKGLASFGPVDLNDLRLWIESSRGCVEPLDMEQVFGQGARVPDVVLEPGVVPRGRVVDRLGEPLHGVLVRAAGRERGPATLTGPDGRFLLPMVPRGSDLWMRPWDFVGQSTPYVDDVELGSAVEVTLDPLGLVKRPWKGAMLRITTRLPEGAASVEQLEIAVVREVDGARDEPVLEPAAAPAAAGTFALEVPVAPGPHRIEAPGALEGGFDLAPTRVEVAAGEVREVALVLTARPRLRILGTRPEDTTISLVSASESRTVDETADAEGLPLAADVRAVLHVRDGFGSVAIVPVGPARDGGREATIPTIPVHHVRWPKDVKLEWVNLLCRGRKQHVVKIEGGLATRAAGDLVLEVNLGVTDHVHRIPLTLPAEGAVDLTVDPRTVPAVPAAALAVFRIVRPTGATGRISRSVSVSGGYGSCSDEKIEASVGARITYSLAGYLTKRILVTKAESREVRWGTASLELTVTDDAGNPVDARVYLDDEALWAPEGVLSVAGLDAGPHRVLIAAGGSKGPGVELRLLLRDGETRTKKVALPPSS